MAESHQPLPSPPAQEQQEESPPPPHPSLEPITTAMGVKVFKPREEDLTWRHFEITDDFFQPTPEELQRFLAQNEEKNRDTDVLRTRAMREIEARKKIRKYTKCLIRVRLPNGLILQASFTPRTPFSAVRSFIKDSLVDPNVQFHTYMSPPMRRLDEDNATLEKLQLVPAAVINVALDAGATGTLDLKPDLTQNIQELHSEALPVATVGDQLVPMQRATAPPQQPLVRTDYTVTSEGAASSSSAAAATKKTPKWMKL